MSTTPPVAERPCDVCGEIVYNAQRVAVLKQTGEVWVHPEHATEVQPS